MAGRFELTVPKNWLAMSADEAVYRILGRARDDLRTLNDMRTTDRLSRAEAYMDQVLNQVALHLYQRNIETSEEEDVD